MLRDPTPTYTNRLQCVECGRVSHEGERCWRAHLTAEKDGEPEEVAIYCPECDEREFGGAGESVWGDIER
jgi:ribosomal protein L44E